MWGLAIRSTIVSWERTIVYDLALLGAMLHLVKKDIVWSIG